MKRKKVIFISAGPGDPELITIKAVNHLKKSEIVLVDRLVSPELIKKYSHSKNEFIFVGKNYSNNQSFNQYEINKLIVQYALKGKYVIRLKGGDCSIFSNIIDELTELKKYNISYEIIPGVTSAIGASSYSGIPLTARGYASSVRFITLHDLDSIDSNQWIDFIRTKDTLVFYMCSKNIHNIFDKLIKKRKYFINEKLMAIIEQATTPMQKTYIVNLSDIKKFRNKVSFLSPSIIIMGKTVSLYHYFKWFNESKNRSNYFHNYRFS
ncbi:uroporphyrinogen-III C-methyltransferase [Blattabacterium cuenoti]|uniref:uroporphyrinogen-III C-methyltransferase n=1 Tax=Blattabacterium cuenoti TaxID=1653831 RepID=UPI00163C2903|nr:uroporphyrinogen-III C-methyltransferase [Blattabacterium cuenoti]